MVRCEWKVVEDSFILFKDEEPTDTYVAYRRGAWQVVERGTYLKDFDFESPSAAMDYVNGTQGMEAPYDEAGGLSAIEAYLTRATRRGLAMMAEGNLVAQTHLTTLKGLLEDPVFDEAHRLMTDQLRIQFEATDILTDRFDNLGERMGAK